MAMAQVQEKQRATRVKEIALPDGSQAWVYSDGAVRDYHGRSVTLPPQMEKHKISQATTSDLLAKRRLVGLRAQLRGIAKGAGVDVPDIDDDLLLAAGSAVEAFTAHMGMTFMQSKSLRGMSDAYDKLVAPLVGDRREKQEEPTSNEQPSILILIQEWHTTRTESNPRVDEWIDAQFKDDTYTQSKTEDAE